eukprot:CAMPEP_0117691242 /NCGR_PEP_ID=MMETSP0804-20121206/25598_1 /TAXON_ID=1074897 /ORGANISM="Tetraselmis astigmatica, Strain CCMP880" /LENGTH=766 /DNA_ID=CAMNT_0005504427 /DNA_START=14 /DNA_END=2314 /DNA_ORIENTATION=+
MNQLNPTPIVKDLVLLGGGHSHVEVLRSFGMRPQPGVRVTLVTRDVHTPYSGMLPGYVAGFYSFDDCHIDLSVLCTFARASLVHAEAVSIQPQGKSIVLANRPPIKYDALSVDIGITPVASTIPGASEHTTPVKPISRLVENLAELLRQAQSGPLKIAIVGGGAGGTELAMALKCRLESERQRHGRPKEHECQIMIVTRGKLLPSHPSKARNIVLRRMEELGIMVRQESGGVTEVEDGLLVLASGEKLEFDVCWWCTDANAAAWIRESGLATDSLGFVAINDCLQSESHPDVFAAGDIASCTAHPRPKAGVFAVRQGPPLAENLRRQLLGQPLQPFAPQSTFLTLIMTGQQHCVASKAGWTIEGGYLWHLKDYIDRKFMYKYSRDLPKMEAQGDRGGQPADKATAFRRGAGGLLLALSQVGASVLSQVMSRLREAGHMDSNSSEDVVVGLDSPDDAAVVRSPGPGMVSVRTVDFFRDFVGDPYVFGCIAANHALGDCHAMGARPRTALAIPVVPYGAPSKVEEVLFQMMAGALEVLNAAGCSLVGGHSGEGAEMALGFSIDGVAKEEDIIHKATVGANQAVVLTKGLGTGAIMAAHMQRNAQGRWVMGALRSMRLSSASAVECLRKHGVTACTDVTGFGLLGHLVEMAKPNQVCVEIDFAAVPLLEGAKEVASAGVTSSLHLENSRAVKHMVANAPDLVKQKYWSVLVDPQTAGGILATLPMEQAEAAVQELRSIGFPQASVIGRTLETLPGDGDGAIRLVNLDSL